MGSHSVSHRPRPPCPTQSRDVRSELVRALSLCPVGARPVPGSLHVPRRRYAERGCRLSSDPRKRSEYSPALGGPGEDRGRGHQGNCPSFKPTRNHQTRDPSAVVGGLRWTLAVWWQGQFRQIRRHLAGLDARIRRFTTVTADHVELAELEKLKGQREVVVASIAQLDNDASKVALPRKYRR